MKSTPKNRLIALFLSLLPFTQSNAAIANFEDWRVVTANDGSGDLIAATFASGTKEALGYRCFINANNCAYVLLSQTICKNNDKYPLLLNSESGGAHVTGYCIGGDDNNGYQFKLSPYKAIEDAAKVNSGIIGFAVPMMDGKFKALRFSLKGAKDATSSVEYLVSTTPKNKNESQNNLKSNTF